jgi:para-aminobenzoate synthetase component 1
LVEEVSTSLSAPQVFEGFERHPFSFFLESGMGHGKLGRYSFMGCDPFLVLRSRGSEITLLRANARQTIKGNPFDILGRLLEVYQVEPYPPIPLVGGAVGYFSYDLCHFMERFPSTGVDDLQFPQCYLGFYDVVLVFDHQESRVYLVSSGFPHLEEEKRRRRARARLEEMKSILAGVTPFRETLSTPGRVTSDTTLRSNFTREGYIRAVDTVREYIAAGDVFQVNLSQRLETKLTTPPYELYRRLREVNPAPFAAYLNFDPVTIVSASPERFLHLQGDQVETRPIKGTRPRGRDPLEDARLAQELLQSGKDRAENIMIVDLERNDLGRVCRYGTVKVTEQAILETYPTVFHLTSTVTGRLRQDKNCLDLLKATFPGGSITGAPKVRAMEIIDELEPTKRSVYTGSIGYLSFSGDLDLNIVIRTFLIKGNKAYFQVGGGIVYDSDPEGEYIETLDKAKALVQALSLSPGVKVG